MSKENPNNVKPLFKDKYYVYALCKPCGTPFYIGKGKGSRINEHFNRHSLSLKSFKNNTIKSLKYNVKREIICYFDSETTAYDYEEFLINHYGLRSEGGLLTNVYKSQSEFKNSKLSENQELAVKQRRVNVPNHVAVGMLYMWFSMYKTIPEIIDRYGYTHRVISKVISGKKNFDIFSKYISSGRIQNKRFGKKPYRPNMSCRKISDSDLIKYHRLFVDGEMNMKTISKTTGLSERTLIKIFRGDTRKYLNLSLNDRLFTYNRHVTKSEVEAILRDRILEDVSYAKIAKKFSKTERLVQRVCKLEGQYSAFSEYLEGLKLEKQT